MQVLRQQIARVWDRVFENSETKWNRKRRLLGYDDLPPSDPPIASVPSTAPTARRGESGIGPTLIIIYFGGIWIARAIIFVGCWIYCIATYGFLLGVGLGWLPAMITAYFTAWLWPLVVIGIVAPVAVAFN